MDRLHPVERGNHTNGQADARICIDQHDLERGRETEQAALCKFLLHCPLVSVLTQLRLFQLWVRYPAAYTRIWQSSWHTIPRFDTSGLLVTHSEFPVRQRYHVKCKQPDQASRQLSC